MVERTLKGLWSEVHGNKQVQIMSNGDGSKAVQQEGSFEEVERKRVETKCVQKYRGLRFCGGDAD